MEYCSVLAGAPNCYLELLDKLQKRILGLLVLPLLPVLNPWLIIEILPAYVFSIDNNLVDRHLTGSTGSIFFFYREVYSLFW